MARRNVELVVRARDDASRALQRLSQNVRGFTESQKQLQTESVATGQAVRRMSRSLDSSGGGNAAQQDRFIQQLRARRHEATLLGAEQQELVRQNRQYHASLARLSGDIARLRTEETSRARAVERQTQALTRSEGEYRRLERQVRTFDQSQRRATAAVERAQRAYDKQFATNARLVASRRQLLSATGEGVSMNARQASSLLALQNRLRQSRDELERYREELVSTRNAQAQQQAGIGRIRDAYKTTSERIREQRNALDTLQGALRHSRDGVAGLTAEQRRLQRATDSTTKSLRNSESAQARAQAETASAAAAAVLGAPEDRNTRLNALRAFRDNAQFLREYGVIVAETGKRTTALTRRVAELGEEAGPALKADLAQSRDELARMRAIMREVAAANEHLRSSLRGSRAAFLSSGAGSERARQSTERLTQANSRLAASQELTRRSGRQSLSILQRIRGQVLAVAAAYVGLFGVVRGIGRVVRSLRTVEGATSRLLALFDGSAAEAAQELEWLRSEARRLGFDLGVLTDTYSKFAIATQGTSLEGEKTRTIFRQVAEASRVNNLTMVQTIAVFRALEQIANKGVFQMEELRQQLGDRLPGAITILAEALEVPIDVLSKLIEEGSVGAEYLEQFGDVLERRYGKRLSAALELTEARIGKFRNALFELQLLIAKGDFRESFVSLLDTLTQTLSSEEMEAFAERISTVLAALSDAIAAFVRNWDVMVIALSAFGGIGIGVVIGRIFEGMAGRIGRFRVEVRNATSSVRTFGLTLRRFALSSGGLGLALGAVNVALALFATQVRNTQDPLEQHKKIVGELIEAYKTLATQSRETSDILGEISLTKLRENERRLREERQRLIEEIAEAIPAAGLSQLNPFDDAATTRYIESLQKLRYQLQDGRIDIRTFVAEVARLGIAQEDPDDKVIQLSADIGILADRLLTTQEAWEDANAAVEDTEKTAARLTKELEDAGDTATKAADDTTAGFRKAEAALKVVLELEKERDEVLKRYQEQLARGADPETLVETENVLRGISAELEQATENALALYRAVDFGNPELTAGVRAQADATIARLENIRATSLDSTLRPIADLFRDQISEFVSVRDAVREELVRLVERGTDLNDLDEQFGRLADAQNTAVEAAKLALARYEGLDNITPEIRAIIADLKSFIDIAQNEVPRVRLELAQQQLSALNSLREHLLEQLSIQINLGNTGPDVVKLKDDLVAVEDQLRRVGMEVLEIADAFNKGNIEAQAAKIQIAELVRELNQSPDQKILGFIQARIAALSSLRQTLLSTPITGAEHFQQLAQDIGTVNEELRKAIQGFITLAESTSNLTPELRGAIAEMKKLGIELDTAGQQGLITMGELAGVVANNVSSAFSTLAENIGKSGDEIRSTGEIFREFAANFLKQIGEMIIQQAIFNAIQGATGQGSGSGGKGILDSIFGFLFHGGGRASKSHGSRRRVDPRIFQNAIRLHDGTGFGGLRRNEIPAILTEGESVFTAEQTNAIARSLAGGGDDKDLTIINTVDADSFTDAALSQRRGKRLVLNAIQDERSAVKQILGIS